MFTLTTIQASYRIYELHNNRMVKVQMEPHEVIYLKYERTGNKPFRVVAFNHFGHVKMIAKKQSKNNITRFID